MKKSFVVRITMFLFATLLAAPALSVHAGVNGAPTKCMEDDCICVGGGVPPHGSGVCPMTSADTSLPVAGALNA